MTTEPRPLPPGSTGLPLLGESPAFLSNTFAFVDERLKKHGRIFRSHVLGRKTAVICGPRAGEIWIDPDVIERQGSLPSSILAIFGGRSLPLLDGESHRERKQQVLAGFSGAALSSYLSGLQRVLEEQFDDWVERRDMVWIPRLRHLAIAGICGNVAEIGPGPDLDALVADYATVTAGFGAPPLPFPWTRFGKAIKARGRLFDKLREVVAEHRKTPRENGLGRILAAVPEKAAGMTSEQALLELHHIVIAGYIIFAELAAIVMRLDALPQIRQGLVDEIGEQSPEGQISFAQLHRMPRLLRFVLEVKRTSPLVPVVFGKAKRDIEFLGHRIPRGWMVLFGLWATNMDPKTFTDPEHFDPERFGDERAEHKKFEQGFVPQGAGPDIGHKCPGTDYATIFMQAFAIVLLRSHTWELPPQNLDYAYGTIPPEPVDGLRVRLRRL